MERIEIYNLLKETFGEKKVLEYVVTGEEKKGLRDPFYLNRNRSASRNRAVPAG